MKAAVVLFPGSNREGDVGARPASGRRANVHRLARGLRSAGCNRSRGPARRLFSYGDYLRCGAIAGRAHIMDAVRRHAARGGLVLGICNGFQILCESGLLPGVLMRNRDLRFVCKRQHLRVDATTPPSPAPMSCIRRSTSPSPMARAITRPGGNDRAAGRRTPRRLPLLRRQGKVGGDADPNGSTNDIAGIYSERFNVLGMMPHPENLIDPLVGGVDGRGLFESLTRAA